MTKPEQEAAQLLRLAGVLSDDESKSLVLNQNDVWGWALAWGEEIPTDQLVEVARLFRFYGYCGLYYWVSERNQPLRSEFHDINRMQDFVRHEEELRKAEPHDSKRAYRKIVYTLGEEVT